MSLLRVILLGVLVATFSSVFAQEIEVVKSDSVAKIEGDEYVIHTVQPKQTLFSIAKTYQVKLSRIAFDNPGVLDGLKLGQALRILKSAQGETAETEVDTKTLELDGDYVLYTVPPKQTLYAISKEYNTTVSAILDANPELADGLKVGSTIRVPVPKMLGKITTEKVKMVGLPQMVKQKIVESYSDTKSSLTIPAKVALLLPFYLTQNDTIQARKLEEEPEEVYERSEIGLAFYQGFLMAVDTLSRLGEKVDVTVIDTENRPWKIQQLIKKGELDNYDLIIGPLYGKVFNEVAKHAYNKCIPIVSPTLKSSGVFDSNDYALRMIPSEESMIKQLGKHLSQSDSTYNIIAHYGTERELQLLTQFMKGVKMSGMHSATFKTVDLSKASRDSLKRSLSVVGRNNLIMLSDNEVKMASLLRAMTNWMEDAYIVLYAPHSWQGFKNVEMDYFEEFRLHSPTPFHVDYQRVDVQLFVQNFRLKYKAEPSTFAFRGYDLGVHLIRNIDGVREHGLDYLTTVIESGFQSDFDWVRLPNGGIENSFSHIIDFTNYELKIAVD